MTDDPNATSAAGTGELTINFASFVLSLVHTSVTPRTCSWRNR